MFLSFRTAVTLLLILPVLTVAAKAQSDEDRKTLEKARASYRVQNEPTSISCNVEVDWDAFFNKMKLDTEGAEAKARIEKLKAIKTSFVSQGQGKTTVQSSGSDLSASVAEGIKQQVQGFFDVYWSQAYGRMLKADTKDPFQLSSSSDGYRLHSEVSNMKVELFMDRNYLITSESVTSPQINAIVKPSFKPGDDGTFWLRGLDETVDMGTSKMVIHFGIDYQKVSVYQIPARVEMELHGSFSFIYNFLGCDAKGSVDGIPAAAK